MTLLRFAQLEQITIAAITKHLANVQVVIGAGQPVNAIFQAAYSTELDMSGATPAITLASSACAGVQEGVTPIVIADKTYTAWANMPDGSGLSVLRLREV